MTSSALTPTSGWTVTSQKQTKQLPAGAQNYVDGVEITFLTGHQVTGSVFVPYAQYTADNVTKAINDRAALLDSVSTLSASGG